MDSVKIVITGDASALQPTIDKLEEIGKVDAKNAERFKKSEAQFQEIQKKHQQVLNEEIEILKNLEKAKLKAFDKKTVEDLDKAIVKTKNNILGLNNQFARVSNGGAKSMGAVVAQTNNLGESVKKSYGFLKSAANIIPGLGVSGLILMGWEALSNILAGIVTQTDKLHSAQTDFSAKSITNTTEYINLLRELSNEIDILLIKQNILTGKQTSEDLQRAQASIDYIKEVEKENIKFYASDRELRDAAKVAEADKLHLNLDLHYANNKAIEKNEELHNQVLIKMRMKYGQELLNITKAKEVERRKLVRDVSVQDLENQKKEIEAQFKIETIYYKDNISDKQELTKELFYIEEQKNEQLLIINEELATRKKEQDIKAAKATITDQEALSNRIYNINLAYNDKISGLRSDFFNTQRVLDAQHYDAILKDAQIASDENVKEVQSDLNERKEAIKEAETNLADTLKLANETAYTEGKITQKEHDKQDIKDQLTVLELKKTNLMKYSNEYIEVEIKEQELKRQLRDKEKEDLKKHTKEAIDNLKQMADFAFDLIEEQIQANIDAIDRKQDMQKDAIDAQRRQAELGHENTLAFEEKRQADLERDRMKEQKKLVKLKELETFMNAIASYSKDDPNSAVAKALAQLAIVKGVEATFMEKGGLLGMDNEKSWQGRKHKGGGDILVHAQTGEGFFNRQEVANMGGAQGFLNFKSLLGSNKLPEIPLSGVMFQGMDTKKLEDKLDNLETAFREKKEVNVHWETLRDRDFMVVETLEKGLKDIIKYELKRPRI